METPRMWSFRKDKEKVGESKKWFLPKEKKQAPDWNDTSVHDQAIDYIGDGWYAIDLVIPKTDGKRVWLYFVSVNENYTLWINGQYVNDNMGVFSHGPFDVEITDKLKAGESNHIVVRVNNQYTTGGIDGPIEVMVEK